VSAPTSRRRPPAAAIAGAAVLLAVLMGLVAMRGNRPAGESPESAVRQPPPPATNAPAGTPGGVPATPPETAPATRPSAGREGPQEAPAPGPGTPSRDAIPPAQRGGRAAGTVTPLPAPPPIPADLPPDHPPITDVAAPQVTVQWLGWSCFYIHSPGGSAVVTDPFEGSAAGLSPPATGAHLVTVSVNDALHGHTAAVRQFQDPAGPAGARQPLQVLRGKAGARGDLKVTPVPLNASGTRFGYLIEAGPLRIAHLGGLAGPLPEGAAAALGRVDLLLLPVGERAAPADAVAAAGALNPRVVVPMAYRLAEESGAAARLRPLEEFVAASPYAVTPRDSDVMLIGVGDLPSSTEIWTLRLRR
jgi:L-ascorbate metabolism protein UlaG (beta-lactamase superfamily)